LLKGFEPERIDFKITEMKKISVLILTMIFTIGLFAQETPEVAVEKNVLKVNTLSLLVGTGSVFYERKFTDMISGQLGFGYMNLVFLEDTRFTGLILTPECRFYLRKNAMDGVYISPYLRYHRFNVKDTETSNTGSLTSTGGGVVFGRQWIFKKGFSIDFFFGGHYSKANIKAESAEESFDKNLFDGVRPRTGLAIGFAF